jgi:DNA-binding response OmpR family regulator
MASALHKREHAELKGSKMRILAVDDDVNNLKMVKFLLSEEGYEVLTASDGKTALALVDSAHPDLVILDVMMPQMDGLEVCRRIRQTADIPIIMLSAKGETADKVQGMELGADDYLAKPFEPSELLVRVMAVLRRSEIAVYDDPRATVSVSGLRLDPVGNRVILPDGKTVDLTPIEFRLLHCLMRNAGRTLSHDFLLSHAWGYEYDGYSNQIAVYIRRLRGKIETESASPKYISTVRGLGYRFEKL